MNVSHILSVEKLRNGGYLPPVLVNRTTDIEVDLSWSGAKSWLQRLESYINEEDQKLFNNIRDAVHENT